MALSCQALCVWLLGLSLHLHACAGLDRLATGESITPEQNQTLVSKGGDFALGFFRPNISSANLHVGIWFNRVPNRTVVWVANRENPLVDSSGALTVTANKNIAVLDSEGRIIWSSNVSGAPSSTYLVLLCTGNLVLRAEDGDIWQSFEHPTDTWLPSMPLSVNFNTGVAARLVSWKDELDPSPGVYSLGLDPERGLQIKLWRGLETWVRSPVWNGQRDEVRAPGGDNSTSTLYVHSRRFKDGVSSYIYTVTKGSPPARVVLTPVGNVDILVWQEKLGMWFNVARKLKPCARYDRCGPNAICEDDDFGTTAYYCKCLPGFEPRNQEEWNLMNYSRGCVRRAALGCEEGLDVFRKLVLEVPDNFRLLTNASAAQCAAECLSNCSCTAYAYSNASAQGSSSRCLVVAGELVDVRFFKDPAGKAEDVYVRLAASELQSQVSSKKGKTPLLIVVPVLSVGLVLLAIFVYIQVKRFKRRGSRRTVMFEDFKVSDVLRNEKNSTRLPALDFNSLLAATHNFSGENKIGEGGFGPVYKGILPQGQEIAIKTLSSLSGQGFEEFKNEVEVIAKLQHTNLVRLLGWCIHDNQKMLIYEYMPNQSLDKFIFDPLRKAKLDWAKRFNIIHGIAQGILYLHRYSRLRVIHRDLKTSNILLDRDMNPKISDFGLAKIFCKNQTEANTRRVVGTLGYMPPEYAYDGLVSEKSDVFSFGVVLLEIITGSKTTGIFPGKHSYNLLGYAWEHWKEGRNLDLIDSSMGSEFSGAEVLKCIQIALLCVQESASDRPLMPDVVSMLTMSTDIATLPSPNQPAFSAKRYPDALEPSHQILTSGSFTSSTSYIVTDDA